MGDVLRETLSLYGQGRFDEALEVAQKALVDAEQACSAEQIATGFHNIAAVYEGQGRCSQARPLYKS